MNKGKTVRSARTGLPGTLFLAGLLLACGSEGGAKAGADPLAPILLAIAAAVLLLVAVFTQPMKGGR
ncbi:hypothetical protein SAMN02910435_01129 [Ruminococcaceae bacterium D5]|nr:hypothetical protein SAMN02910435_01129 [Ruminococcaceae bacterium D5]